MWAILTTHPFSLELLSSSEVSLVENRCLSSDIISLKVGLSVAKVEIQIDNIPSTKVDIFNFTPELVNTLQLA